MVDLENGGPEIDGPNCRAWKWRTMLSVVQVEQQWCFHNSKVSQIARSRFESM